MNMRRSPGASINRQALTRVDTPQGPIYLGPDGQPVPVEYAQSRQVQPMTEGLPSLSAPGFPAELSLFDQAAGDLNKYRAMYRRISGLYGGLELPESFVLQPFIVPLSVPLNVREGGAIVALDQQTPTVNVPFRFEKWTFVKRLAATVQAPRLTAEGQPDAQYFRPSPLDYVWCRVNYKGSQQTLMTERAPLSTLIGGGGLGGQFVFDALPWLPANTELNFEFSIVPPACTDDDVALVESVGGVTIVLICEVIPQLR